MTHLLYGVNVHANGIRQHVLRYGGDAHTRAGRDPVVLVPGITSPAVTWGFVAERFGARFDTWVVDIRGRGLSEASATLDYGIEAQAEDVIALAEALGLARYQIVGHSMGARIGAHAAARRPAGLTRLVMVDPPVSGPGRRAYPAGFAWYEDSIRDSIRGIDAEGMRTYCPTWTDEQRRLRAEWLHTCDLRAVRESYDGFHTVDVHVMLPRIGVPTLLMTAERGDVVRDEDAAEIERLVPGGVRHVRVAGAGHMIPWDNEEGFYAAVGDFLGHAL